MLIREQNKERYSNLEIYRIIVMLLIVAHHYVVNSGLSQVLEGNGLNHNSIFLYIFGMWGKAGINCFVLITGYFMCKSEATVSKFLKLVLEVVFYHVTIYILFLIFGLVSFDFVSIIRLLSPISSVGDGFMTGFLFFYLFIPFLNRLIRNMDRMSHFKLIFLSLFIYTFWDSMPTITVTFNYVTWFIVLYFISSYIRLYPNEKYDKNLKFWGLLTLSLVLTAVGSVFLRLRLDMENPYRWVSDSNAILAIAVALSSFMYFKNLNIKQNHIINTIAASMLGVLLIHANSDAMRQWLWRDTLNNVYFFSTPYCIVHAIISVIVVFMACVMIDYCRIQFIEKPFMQSFLYKNIVCKIEKLINKE